MIRIQQLKLNSAHSERELEEAILKALSIEREDLVSYKIARRSTDARKKPDIRYVYSVDAEVRQEEKLLKRRKSQDICQVRKKEYQIPQSGRDKLHSRPVIVGTGPAGLFCGLLLARAGYCPILLERGDEVQERQRKVEHFWNTGELDERSNVQFGEGGAGTFSDGKLNTGVKDPAGRNRYVLECFVEAGAPEEILWLNKPHIGTDILRQVVQNMRTQICSLGGEVRFLSQVTDIQIEKGRVVSLQINHREALDCQILVLAIGHSARDTFEMLECKRLCMKPKSFAVGLRIEHPQSMIDFSQYGRERSGDLPVADYKLTRQTALGRGVYSFCMCPGGYVVNASSERGRTAVNGMSYHSREGRNANSAMVVTVTPEDYSGTHALAGVQFQRELEEKAYLAGKGKVPVQLLGDFCAKRITTEVGEVEPCILGGYSLTGLHGCLPLPLYEALRQGILECGQLIKGFDRPDAVLSGVESRTSSPVRIERGKNFESSIQGLYPCGEGAGYAGGITSAAMDGLKVAEAIIQRYSNRTLV